MGIPSTIHTPPRGVHLWAESRVAREQLMNSNLLAVDPHNSDDVEVWTLAMEEA